MYTTYHLASAQELNNDILEAIKAAFKSRPITIIIAEEQDTLELADDMKAVLEQRLQEDTSTYIAAADSINLLNKKYGL